MEHWRRKRIRIPEYDYASPGCYFVTICTKGRVRILWEDAEAAASQQSTADNVAAAISRQNLFQLSTIGKIVDKAINQIPVHYAHASVDKYCIMSDHVHLILRINANMIVRQGEAAAISTIIGQMKRWSSKQAGRPIWQKSFIDRVIRNEKGYLAVWEYIDNNPASIDFADDNIDFSMM